MNNQMNQFNNTGYNAQYNSPSGNAIGMTYHNVFMVICILSIIGSLQNIGINFVTIIFMAFMVFFLWKRTKAGYIMCLIYNWLEIIMGALMLLLGIVCFNEYSELESTFSSIIPIEDLPGGNLITYIILMGVISLVWGIVNIIYYKKRKQFFVNAVGNNAQNTVVGMGQTNINMQQPVMPVQPQVVSQTNCPYCGTPKAPNSQFCVNCGAKF